MRPPASELTPGRRPRILEALQQLAAQKEAQLFGVSGRPHLRVLKIGPGMLVLDRRSRDASGNSNLHLAVFQQAWHDEITRCGLAPGCTDAALVPAGRDTLAEWFFGAAGGAN
jgi:hypothetical protein